jgi:hypothetical protein
MRLAMAGKLKVVLSDVSLAYGVNMPFRTCVYAGEMGGKLDALMAQQMAGRSGRRGLETEGHMVYVGARNQFITNLMLAKIPALKGVEPRYQTSFIPEMLSKFTDPSTFPNQSKLLGGLTLEQYVTRYGIEKLREQMQQSTTTSVESSSNEVVDITNLSISIDNNNNRSVINVNKNFRDISINTLLTLGLIEECNQLPKMNKQDLVPNDFRGNATFSSYKACTDICSQLWCTWELRQFLPESILIGSLLPDLYDEFIKGRRMDDIGDNESVQLTFFAFLLMMVDRKPYTSTSHYEEPLLSHHWIASKPDLLAKLRNWEDKMQVIQDKLRISDVNGSSKLLYMQYPPHTELDATVFNSIVYSSYSQTLPSNIKDDVKCSLTNIAKVYHILYII